ncbi:hypothetical protein ACIQM4_01110 [Streptomyces sp. NPDC091272]|uniref:hypothetical protein n=1 Tax=Streptomyces sp. NPDC091272 TaxID=3365981 RepID=UPI00381E8B57
MSRGRDGRPQDAVEQIVFRWDAANRSGNTGFGPVAWSCARSQVQDLFRSSVAPLLRGNFQASDGPDASGLVRLEQHGQGDAMLLRRTPHRDPGGRPGTLCHALIGPAQVLDPDTCIGLDSWAWADDFFGDVDWGEVQGELPLVPGQALRDSALRGYAELVDEVDGSGPGSARPLIAATAELIRHPRRVQMLLDRDGGRSACRTMMGLYGIFSGIVPDRWTYATRDTAESTLIRFAFVRRWPGSAAPDIQRTRVDPDERRGDRAEELAVHLVRHYLARVGRQSRMFEVADALGHAVEPSGSAPLDAELMHRTAERALGELEHQQNQAHEEFQRQRDDRRRQERALQREQELQQEQLQQEQDRARERARERERQQSRGQNRPPTAGLDHELHLERERKLRRDRPARPAAAFPTAPPPAAPERATQLASTPPAPAATPPAPRGPAPTGPGPTAPVPTGSAPPAPAPTASAPPSAAPPSAAPPSAVPPPPARPPEPSRQSARPSEPPSGPDTAAPGTGAHWPGPSGVRRARPVWRRKSPLTYGDLLAKLGSLDERSPDSAREQVAADLPDAADTDLVDALGEELSYPATTLLVTEAAGRWPHWKESTRRRLCEAVLDAELFLPRWHGRAGTFPGEETRAANAAALYRWAVRPLAAQDGTSARLTALLPELRTGPDPAARAAVRQILEEGELPGLREEVWRALLTRGREPRGRRSSGPDRPPREGVPHASAARPSVPERPGPGPDGAARPAPAPATHASAASAAPSAAPSTDPPPTPHEEGYERRIRYVLLLAGVLVALFLLLLAVVVAVAL